MPGLKFLFTLAGHLGKTVGELVGSLDSWEWALWEALAAEEPFGEARADWRAAQIAAEVHNMAGRYAPRTSEVGEFLLKFERPARRDDPEALAVRIRAALAQAGARHRQPAAPPPKP